MSIKMDKFIYDVKMEVINAKAKFPSNKHLALAFAEESGELVKALLDFEQKGGTKEQIWKEAVQTCAMAIRVLFEGDGNLEYDGIQEVKTNPRYVG